MKSLTTKNRENVRHLSSYLENEFKEVSASLKIVEPDNYFSENGDQTLLLKTKVWLRGHSWKWIISPLVLMACMLIYSTVPTKIFRGKLKVLLFTSSNRLLQRMFDIFGAIIGIILFSVFFLLVPLLIKLDSKGPVFFCQKRIGANRRKGERRKINVDTWDERRAGDRRKTDLGGKPFYVFKFRIMKEGTKKMCSPIRTSIDDPGITTLGRFMRYFHIDAFPQLINIFNGDMSFVGPRAERPQSVVRFAGEIPNYKKRMKVKPGLTGLAQMKNGYDYSLESIKAKLEDDLYYCQNKSFSLYVRILLKTIFMLFFKKDR